MTYTLTITSDDETKTEVVKVTIGEISPLTAALTVMEALQGLEPKRKRRSDAGTPRKPDGKAES